MERSARPLTTRDTILLITHANDDEVGGRTVMQKLAYFTALALNVHLEHRAHFFGPFSSRVEDALGNAVIAGELRETTERFPDWRGGPDLLKYTYDLTPAGKRRVDALIEHNSADWDQIRDSVRLIRGVLPGLDQKTLSAAAKTYLIISESETGVDEEQIPDLARRLGWELDADQVSNTMKLLGRLDLVEYSED